MRGLVGAQVVLILAALVSLILLGRWELIESDALQSQLSVLIGAIVGGGGVAVGTKVQNGHPNKEDKDARH